MLRHRVKENESDRYIVARSVERDRMINRYMVKEREEISLDRLETTHSAGKSSEPKTKTPVIIKDQKEISDKIYLSLLKTQLFQEEENKDRKRQVSGIKLGRKRKNSTNSPREVNNLFVIRDSDENSESNINRATNGSEMAVSSNSSQIRTPIANNLGSHYASSSNFSRRLNFTSDCLMSYKKQKLDLDEITYTPGKDLKSSFKELVNFDLSKEDSICYNKIFNQKNIPSSPYKILDAPLLKDDFYLHLLDWSSKDILAVGLEQSVYLYEAKTSKVVLLKTYENDKVTAMKWLPEGNLLITGLNSGKINIWDIYKNRCVGSYEDHSERIGVFAPVVNNHNLFSAGSLDHSIVNYDLRARDAISTYNGHTQEVCGLKWSYDGKMLASGGNDNKLIVWSNQKSSYMKKLSAHHSAVKAVDWSYHKLGLLASGGGTQDRTIKLWNVNTMTLIDSIDTASQVCNIAFSKVTNEFVSTHGYSDNLILVWDFEKLEVIASLKGHRDRVIYMATSPDGRRIVTGAGDETIRFWEVFRPEENEQSTETHSLLSKRKIR